MGIKFIKAAGKNKFVHVPTCEVIQDWDLNGCELTEKIQIKKINPCPKCGAMLYLISLASDDVSQKSKYNQYENLVKNFGITLSTMKKLSNSGRIRVELKNNRLYVRKRDDLFYIDFSLDDVVLFHNNYNSNQRKNNPKQAVSKGFHEHALKGVSASGRFNEALRQIANYDFSEAQKVHKKRERMVLSEYDAAFWGFTE